MKVVYAIKCTYTPLSNGVFCVKRFWPVTRVENNSQEKFTILHVPHIGFLCYSNWDQILLYGRWLKVRMNICTALWSFVNFCCLSQSAVSTDNRKVSNFFAFQHLLCRCRNQSYMDRFLNCEPWFAKNLVPLSSTPSPPLLFLPADSSVPVQDVCHTLFLKSSPGNGCFQESMCY